MGSLIALLAVADVLGNNTAAVATYSKRLVLTALMGEPWGFMGSKRLLWEMDNRADTVTGLHLDQIEQASITEAVVHMSFTPPMEPCIAATGVSSCRSHNWPAAPELLFAVVPYGGDLYCAGIHHRMSCTKEMVKTEVT